MGRESCTEMTWAENGKGLQEEGVSSLDQGQTVENLGCSGWKYHRRTSELLKLDGGTSCSCALRVLGQSKALYSLQFFLVATGISITPKHWATVRWAALDSVRRECFPPLRKADGKAKGRVGLEGSKEIVFDFSGT